MLLSAADQLAFDRVSECRPQWVGMCQVSDVVAEQKNVLLYAGPPFSSVDIIPAPVMNSLCVGAVWEGWAKTYAQAKDLILQGQIKIASAQDHNIVVPLAGVVSPSMQLMVIVDANNPSARKYSVLNEGMVHCTRLGKLDPELQGHLTWLNGELSEWIKPRLLTPIDLLPIIEAALNEGDDCHGRTIAGSALLADWLFKVDDNDVPEAIETFLKGAMAFALNVWMAASSLMMSVAEGVEGASLITKAGGNGHDFGVQIATKPGVWFTMPAPEVKGAVETAYAGRTAVGAIGDSAVVDFIGLGGQVLNTAPASYNGLKDYLPEDALNRPDKALTASLAGFGGRPAMTCARQVVDHEGGPMVVLGMIEDRGEVGRIGGGVADVPVSFFRQVLQEAGL
ncbi:DUF1116 domain-containing protein [Amphritea sp. 1_MG-2023]|uniref:oxamate carbamoyltransferase subunit AllG family protein n=1 Tax=Amphritea sp. 1_MG-2023 TaxID=3062670 RepID=UPI0026E1CD6C|nr:DUF1116 domain-containing protein [Amphritea sp. 1_MG-2023]MDO6564532.1 DUF1116 domain-containing protein [Amphritea sp. 1_MG-2023]